MTTRGTDEYPFKNEFEKHHFQGSGIDVYEGSMVTV